VQRVIPDNCADVLVSDEGRAVLVGPATHAELPRLAPGTLIRGLRIEPYAIRTVFGVDADELTDRTLPLDAVLGSRAARVLADAVWRPCAADLRAALPDSSPDRATVGVVRALTAPSTRSVDAIADRTGYSARHLRRLVRAETGLSPKALHRVARLQEFLRRAERGTPVSAAAAAAGYADQPHATREVRALTGLTPRSLLAERAG